MYKELLKKMNEAEKIEDEKVYKRTVHSKNLTMLNIRDYLIINAEIVDEDLQNMIYTSYFRRDPFNLNRSLVGFLLEEDNLTIASYSRNKFRNKKFDEKLVDDIINELIQGKRKNNKRKKYVATFISLILLVFFIIGCFLLPFSFQATHNYNEAVLEFNSVAKNYNDSVVLVSVDNIEGVPGKVELLKEENEDIFSITFSLIKGNLLYKINKDIETINSMINTLDSCNDILKNINEPSSEYLKSKLEKIDEIDKIASVSLNNDPNGFLNKKHGYSSCLYFTVKGIELDKKVSDPIILGTDGGGCIEVYSNLADAEARCEYLKQFDDTILYTGSYAIVGTMVIRTSYVLTNEQQYHLTDLIVQQLTKS